MDSSIPTNLNMVLVEGNLLAEPQFNHANGGPYCHFDMAIDDREHGQAIHIGVKVKGKLAMDCKEDLIMGARVLVKGKLVQSRWNNQHGRQRRTEIKASYVKIL